ncbi:MAG: glycerophosphodiester phosphodiesterase [Acidimicrobiia bacterium]|nr:glycerophosphodiester phosphodiesterase [Acidimicrobiia bacterium]
MNPDSSLAPRTPLILGHRGAPKAAPENTLSSFAAALAEGADGVELDVHSTSDGVLVVLHDPEIDNVGVIRDTPWPVINAAVPSIPTLEQVLDVCNGTLVNIEIKNSEGDAGYDPTQRTADLVVALLASRDKRDEVVISSFELAAIARVREIDAEIPTGFLYAPNAPNVEALATATAGGHSAVHPHWVSLGGDEGAKFVDDCHASGVKVNVWTVNDEPVLVALLAAGVDCVITDTPAILRSWL